jgi:hypothetical protein
MDSVRDAVVTVSSVLVAVSALLAVWEYRLKVQGEKRLQESAASEIDTRMSKLFAELMWLAHARGGSQISEKCVEKLFEKGAITEGDFGDLEKLNEKLSKACAINLPVGAASQDAAIASIGVLGSRYEILREPARAGLNSLKSIKEKAGQIDKALALLDEDERRTRA